MSVELLRSELKVRGCEDLVPHVDRLVAALDAAEKERDHWKDEAAQLDASVEKLEARVAALEKAGRTIRIGSVDVPVATERPTGGGDIPPPTPARERRDEDDGA